MKALILAAGLGTRLRPLTEKTPKPLLPIAGKPLLAYHLEALHSFGVGDVLINTHYLPEQIEHFVKDFSTAHPDFHVQTVFESELLGSAGTLKANKDFFHNEEDFFIIYGDNLTNIDYKKLLERHHATGGVVTIACYKEERPETKGIIEFNEQGKISRFIEKPKPEQITTNYANAGIYVVNKNIFECLEHLSEKPLDFGHHVFPVLLHEKQDMYVYLMTEVLLDIGTHESYTKAQHIVI